MLTGGGGTFGDCVQGSNEGLDVTSESGKKGESIIIYSRYLFVLTLAFN
jgi:hypothetical protein